MAHPNHPEKLYDLLIYDCDLEGEAREEAKSQLAKLLAIGVENVEPLLNSTGTVVGQALPAGTAQQFHLALSAIHIRCNYRPTTRSNTNLELTPLKSEKSLICPACAFLHHFPENQQAPLICKKCGIVFAKFDQVEQRKEEREKVKRALLSKHQRMLEAQQEELERQREASRRAELEEQIRKELGLPKFATSRRGLMGIGTAVFVLGLSVGGGGVVAVQTWTGVDDASLATAHAPGNPPKALNPQHFDDQINKLLAAEAVEAPASAKTSKLPLGGLAKPQIQSYASTASDPQVLNTISSPLLKEMLAEFGHDAELDGFLLARARSAFGQGALAEAMLGLTGVSQPRLRIEQGKAWADWLKQQGYATPAETVYAYLVRGAERLPAGSADQIEALALLARLQAAAGFPVSAQAALKTAEKLAANAPTSMDKAVAAAALAATQAELTHTRPDFRKAQAGLGQIANLSERDTCKTRLARIYAQAGDRAAANRLLQDSLSSTAGIEAAARLYAEWGETAQTLNLAHKLSDDYTQGRLLHRILADAFAAGRAESAAKILGIPENPEWRTRTQGLLVAAHVQYAFETARNSVESIASVGEKAAILSELARFSAHGGDDVGAAKLFEQAGALANTVPDTTDHDAVLAILAYNQALARPFKVAQARPD